MLNKKTKKSYGAYIDYFLEECEVVIKPFDVTHIHVTETYMGTPEGIYRYEPKTGTLALDDEHFGVMYLANAVTGSKTGKIVFLKHNQTWNEMKEEGLIKETEGGDIEQTIQKRMQGLGIANNTQVTVHATTPAISIPQPEPIPPTTKTGGMLIKKLFNKQN